MSFYLLTYCSSGETGQQEYLDTDSGSTAPEDVSTAPDTQSGDIQGEADISDNYWDSFSDQSDTTTASEDFSTEDISVDQDSHTATYQSVTSEQLHNMLEKKDFLLINVHIPYAGEIPGTDEHIAFTEIDALEVALGHDLATKAVLYCRSGSMSLTATNALVDLGYYNLFDLDGGMYSWSEAGYPLIHQTSTLKVGDKAPDFSLPDLDGTMVSLGDYLGNQPVLLFFHMAAG